MNNKLVLIVDDEIDLVQLLKEEIEYEGYQTITANSGNEAFRLFKKNPDIGLVLSDIRMKDGNGVDLLKNVKKDNSYKGKFYLLTGYADYSKEVISNLGADDLIDKPFSLEMHYSMYRK